MKTKARKDEIDGEIAQQRLTDIKGKKVIRGNALEAKLNAWVVPDSLIAGKSAILTLLGLRVITERTAITLRNRILKLDGRRDTTRRRPRKGPGTKATHKK